MAGLDATTSSTRTDRRAVFICPSTIDVSPENISLNDRVGQVLVFGPAGLALWPRRIWERTSKSARFTARQGRCVASSSPLVLRQCLANLAALKQAQPPS